MTPGFAQPRSKLPWLPYESEDRVIINSHNFAEATPTGIGGEVGWWCPSLDDSGNGTATMHDLIGSRHCSLVGEATSANAWGVDTDNSGTRAVLFNGARYWNSGDRFTELVGTSSMSLSFWAWRSSSAHNSLIGQSVSGGNYANVARLGTRTYFQISPIFPFADSGSTGWDHFMLVKSGTTMTGYRNNTLVMTDTGAPSTYPSIAANFLIGYYAFGAAYATGKKDDIRIFNRALTSGDRAALSSRRAYQP